MDMENKFNELPDDINTLFGEYRYDDDDWGGSNK